MCIRDSIWEYDQKRKHAIIECTFDKLNGFWRPLRLRTDKVSPNSISTAFATLETVAANMDMYELTDLLDPISKTEKPIEDVSSLSEAERKLLFESGRKPEIIHANFDTMENAYVSEHYDIIQKMRNESSTSKDPRLDMLRKVNNWAKAGMNICLLYTSPSPRDKRQYRMPSSA